MGQYIVVAPCAYVSGGRAVHHVRPTTAPVEVDDDVAGPLVTAGKLTRFGATPPRAKPPRRQPRRTAAKGRR